MRWPHFILLQCLLVAMVGGIIFIHDDHASMIKTPPASLVQWYKPENKRQVWLHNMFNLRREMQAVEYYVDNKDAEHLGKWVTRLNEHYLEIGEMVPEWKRKLNKKAMTHLQESANSHRYQDVSLALDELEKSCQSCHAD